MEENVKTVKEIMKELGQQNLIEGVINHVNQYREVSPVHEGIFKTKIQEIFQRIMGDQEPEEGNGLVLVQYLSTKDDNWGYFDYVDRFGILYEEDILSLFRNISAFDAVVGMESRWSLMNFFSLNDLDVVLLSKLNRGPKLLLWHWSRWEDILSSKLLGTAQVREEKVVVELTARYMEYLLGNLEDNSEMKTFPRFIMPEYVSEEDINCDGKLQLIRDRVQNELSLYGEIRYAYRQLTRANSD